MASGISMLAAGPSFPGPAFREASRNSPRLYLTPSPRGPAYYHYNNIDGLVGIFRYLVLELMLEFVRDVNSLKV